MRTVEDVELPAERAADMGKARRLAWWTLAWIASSVTLLYLTMGASQAMRTSFFEELVSAVPTLAFLIGTSVATRAPSPRFPYGLHGAVSVGYLVSALALFAMGLFLLIEAGMKILGGERTTIGGMALFGQVIWAGWPMLVAVAYAGIPSILFGHAKLPLASRLHDKVLYAEARMMRADWMAELATGIGVLGVGFGYPWLDPLAAAIVSLDIIKDGATNLGVALSDLIERRPEKTDRSGFEPIPEELRRWAEELDWVASAEVRMREVGRVFFADLFVVARPGTERLPERVRETIETARHLDWRLHDVTVTVLDRLEPLRPRRSGAGGEGPEPRG